MNETGEEKKTNRTNATPRGAEKEGGSRRTRANDREGAGRAPVRDRRTEGRERRRKDRGGARGAGDAATFSLYIRGATHSDHPGAPSSSFYTVAHESQSLSRGKKIHPGVTWRIRKLPTCDATKNSDDDDALGTSAPLPPGRRSIRPRASSREAPRITMSAISCSAATVRPGSSLRTLRVSHPAARAGGGAPRAGRKTNNPRMRSADPRFRRTTDDPIPDRSVVHSQVVRAPRVAAARRAPHNGVAVRCARSTTRRPPPAVPSSASRSPRRGGNI